MDHMDKEPPDKVRTMMNYKDTFQFDDWKASRECAEEMMRTIPSLKEDFELDEITLGDGQCFSTSCLQQLRRPDVNNYLDPRWRQHVKKMTPFQCFICFEKKRKLSSLLVMLIEKSQNKTYRLCMYTKGNKGTFFA